jgi:hypothetical protein
MDGNFILNLFSAVRGGQWVLVGGMVCAALVWVLRNYGSKWVPWFATNRGGALLAIIVGLLSSGASALASGAVAWSTLLDGLLVAAGSLLTWVIPAKVIGSDIYPGIPAEPPPGA